MIESVQIAGLAELADALKELPDRIARNALRGAVGAGARVIRDEAKLRAPLYTGPVSEGHPPPGTLKRSIVQKQIAELSSLTKQVYYVTVRKGKKYQKQGKKGNLSQDAYYASWVEFGHWINTTGKALGGTGKMSQRAAAVAAGHNKFMPAHPFLRPAYEAKKMEAVEAIKTYLDERIQREAAALAK